MAEIFALESLPQKFLKNSDRGCFLQKNKNHGLCKLTEILSDKIPKKKKGIFGADRKCGWNFGRFFTLRVLLKNLLPRNPVFSINAHSHTKRKSQGNAIIFSNPISECSTGVQRVREGARGCENIKPFESMIVCSLSL